MPRWNPAASAVQYGTAIHGPASYTGGMRKSHVTTFLTMTWALLLGTVGYTIGTTAAGWAFLAVLGTVPMALVHFWPRPVPTMSEQIQDALR